MSIDEIENIVKIASACVATIGGLLAAFKAIFEMRENRKQRELEYHWKQAAQAQSMLSIIKTGYETSSALQMLDWGGREYQISEDKKDTISDDELDRAMRVKDLSFTRKEAFIRDCFDRLFESLEDIEHFIRRDLVQFSDVSKPLQYYIEKIKKRDSTLTFIEFYDYHLAMEFINRFNETEISG